MGGGQSRARGLTSRADGDRGGREADDNKHNGYFILSFKEEKIKVNIALQVKLTMPKLWCKNNNPTGGERWGDRVKNSFCHREEALQGMIRVKRACRVYNVDDKADADLSFSLPVSNIWRYWEKVGTGTWPSRSSCKSRTKSRWFRWNHILWQFKGFWSCCRWWQPPCWASTAKAGNQWRPSTRRPRLTRGATRFLAPVRLWNKKVLFF